MDRVHRWRVLLVGHKKRGNRSVYFRSKQAQSDHKIYGCIIREGNKFPRHYYHKKLLRWAILQRNWDKDSISDSHTHFKPTKTFQYREPPLVSYRRGKSLTDILVKAKLLKRSKTYYIKKQRESCLPPGTSCQKFGPNWQFCLGLKSDRSAQRPIFRKRFISFPNIKLTSVKRYLLNN